MTKSKVFEILDSVIIENDFWLSEMDECREKNFDLMENITSIFKMEKARDFTLLMASIKLLCKDPVPVINYFREENKQEIQFEEPVRNDLLIIATVFQTNPVFFSMCWNFVAMIENELAVKNEYSTTIIIIMEPSFEPQTKKLDIFNMPAVAATSKTDNLTYIAIEPLGELQIQGSEGDDPFITAILFLNPEFQKSKLELKVSLEINGNEHVFVIKKDSENVEHDVPASNPWFTDYSQGYRIKAITWNLLK